MTLAPAVAAGQNHTVQGTFTTSSGVTSNPNLAVNQDGEEQSDLTSFVNVSPGLVYAYQARSSLHLITYNFLGTMFFGPGGANSYSNSLAYQGSFVLGPRTNGTTFAGVTQGQTQNLAAGGLQAPVDPGGGVGGAAQAVGITFVNGNVGQTVAHEFGNNWTGSESLTFGYFKSFASDGANQPGDTFAINGNVGAEKVWQRTGLGLRFLTAFFSTGAVTNADDMEVQPGGDQLSFGPLATFRRDLTEEWNTTLGLGIQGAMRTDAFDESGILIQPVGSAALTWSRLDYTATLGYNRTFQANLQLGQLLLSDQVSLSGGVPLGLRGRLNLFTTASYQRARPVNANIPGVQGNLAPGFDVIRVAGGPTWQVAENFNAALLYNYNRQNAPDDVGVADITVHTVVLTLGGVYPAQARPLSALFSGSSRIDGGDNENPLRDERGDYLDR